jgi:hypothetical protein
MKFSLKDSTLRKKEKTAGRGKTMKQMNSNKEPKK